MFPVPQTVEEMAFLTKKCAYLFEAAKESLKSGSHEGPCEFLTAGGPCWRHVGQVEVREKLLKDAILNIDPKAEV